MKEFWTSLATLMGVWAFFQTLLHAILPPELHFAGVALLRRLYDWLSSYCYYDISEIDGVSTNELYNSAQLYLASSSASITGSRLTLSRPTNSSGFTFSLSQNDRLTDTFDSITVLWEHHVMPRQQQNFSWRPLPEDKRRFTLKMKKSQKARILKPYLDHIMETAKEIKRKNQDRFLYTNPRGGSMDGSPWESVPFKHPSTFETLAMDQERKQEILSDLGEFASGQAFYQKTGRAWKRGYLLYGPPGTGKSSMIAAMANFLGYDIYDLELTEVNSNSELRKLLMKTSSKSIIVIEDIDCSISLSNRKKTSSSSPKAEGVGGEEKGNSVTLSGLLNFTDGLWSCCGSERIFVFTTNHVEKLDPALLRSGRMDMHIHMGYCSYEAAKILIKNYLGFDEKGLEESVWEELEDVIDAAKMTPADVSEVLIKNRRGGKENAVRELVRVLKERCERERVEDEQVKRALDSPNQGVEVEEEQSCEKKN